MRSWLPSARQTLLGLVLAVLLTAGIDAMINHRTGLAHFGAECLVGLAAGFIVLFVADRPSGQ